MLIIRGFERRTTAQAAEWPNRWDCHPSSVIRVMRRYGVSGIKFGATKQAARRFSLKDVETVEKLAGLNGAQCLPTSPPPSKAKNLAELSSGRDEVEQISSQASASAVAELIRRAAEDNQQPMPPFNPPNSKSHSPQNNNQTNNNKHHNYHE